MKTLERLKVAGEDFEWYPTTNEILTVVKSDIFRIFGQNESVNILDCGAGDGRSLEYLKMDTGKLYAIEKSTILLQQMPSEIYTVGTDFNESTLIDKKVDVIFCNPPYSEYEQWASRIISEANACRVYLVIPERWKDSSIIADAIESRDAEFRVLGSFDFLNAERKARAKVNIVSVKLHAAKSYGYDEFSPFNVWFDKTFKLNMDTSENLSEDAEKFKETIQDALVEGRNIVQILVELYCKEMESLQDNYQAVAKLNPSILKELGVDVAALREELRQKIEGLKARYWDELFSNFGAITSRLTTISRKRMKDKLFESNAVDFTESNISAITIWAIKNANQYFDSQLVELVEEMIGRANIKLYKSNKRTFGDEDWRYGRKAEGLDRFALELRIIIHDKGGIKSDEEYGYSFDYTNKLYIRAHEFLSDIITVANNLGFHCPDNSKEFEWSSGKKIVFNMENGKPLMEVKAFKNRNIHVKFNQDFLRKLNVEFGRLKGWLKDKREASEELNIPLSKIEGFDTNFKIESTTAYLLLEGKNKWLT